jgi:hypothetical protein
VFLTPVRPFSFVIPSLTINALTHVSFYVTLGKFLTDLIIINDGNADLIGTHINFHKRILWYTVVSKLLSFQRVPYLFEYVPAIQQLLRDITHPKELLDEEQLYQISLQIFPKGATKEQD